MADDLNLLQQKARDWALKVVELHKTPVPSYLQGQKNALISAAKTIKSAIEKVIGAQSYLAPMNQLGFIPVIIGVAGVAWAVAAITKWTLDYSKFKTEVGQFNSLVKSGVSPESAANIVNSQKELSLTGMLKMGIPLAVGGFALWYFMKKKGSKA